MCVEKDVPEIRSAGLQSEAGVRNSPHWLDPIRKYRCCADVTVIDFADPRFVKTYLEFEAAYTSFLLHS